MLIKLDQIADEPFSWRESPPISLASLGRDELLGLSDLTWSGRVSRELEGYRLEARLHYKQTLSCTRCLKPVEDTVNEEIELLLRTGSAEPLLGEHELSANDLETLHVDGDELDTTPILLEQIQLNIPLKPLCREDCAGLCPQCGADRNTAACDCAETEIDPRWRGLERWRQG